MNAESKVPDLLRTLWDDFDFHPNAQQKNAIVHGNGPLFLPAGPGSGKTRVLLWRVANLLTTHNVPPEEIFLSTFTEKASLQLKNGLHTLIGAISQKTGKPFDLAKLYVGTVHSLCQSLLRDRRFSPTRERPKAPILLDELDQYMFIRRNRNWNALLAAGPLTVTTINDAFDGSGSTSRHRAITHLLAFFNRLSEEMLDPEACRKRTKDKTLRALLDHYEAYLALLKGQPNNALTDLSLLQRVAVDRIRTSQSGGSVFKHVIVDEYQDTNPVQEQLFFHLACGHKNICVVGDDDQALYRFRGATVENFVDFPSRCASKLDTLPRTIGLGRNYRSRQTIVGFYNEFIVHPSCDWRKKPNGAYRVMDKEVVANRKDAGAAVVASTPAQSEDVAIEIANFVRALLDKKKVADPNQIAFLFPSLKSPHVGRMRSALAEVGLEVYAPRAGQFLDVPEAIATLGLMFQVFGTEEHRHSAFNHWLTTAYAEGGALAATDTYLDRFLKDKRAEIARIASDYGILAQLLRRKGWLTTTPYDPSVMQSVVESASGLSQRGQAALGSRSFRALAISRSGSGRPFTLGYAITRATSLDWNVLDFFYQLAGFTHFRKMYDLAESGDDEGPVCNLSLVSQYLGRFLDQYRFPISGKSVLERQFLRLLTNFLYILFRRGESEYEDADDPFPRGRIPFITIHQSKGLEFPVVVLGNPRKDARLQRIEEMVAPLLTRQGEPYDKMPTFDVMRMFYVALSRAKNLLVIAHYKGQGLRMNEPFKDLLNNRITRIPSFPMSSMPSEGLIEATLPQTYSYTGDFMAYRKCPRQYMLFRKFKSVPSRSQTMFFGSLVHQTIDDIHQYLIGYREAA